MQRVLAVAAGLLAAGAPSVSLAAWNFQDNGPRFGARDEVPSTVLVLERVSLAPKDSVADLRSFQELEAEAAGQYGPPGLDKPGTWRCEHLWGGVSRAAAAGPDELVTACR